MCRDQAGCRFAVAVGGAYLQQGDCGVCMCECVRRVVGEGVLSFSKAAKLPWSRSDENNERIRNPTLLVSSCVKEWTAERDLSPRESGVCLVPFFRVESKRKVEKCCATGWVGCKEWLAKSLALSPVRSHSAFPSLFGGDFWVSFFAPT